MDTIECYMDTGKNRSGMFRKRDTTLAFASPASGGAFTLVDVLLASAILSFLGITLCGAFSFGFSLLRVGQENLRADQILVQKLETIRLYDWTKVTSGTYVPQTLTDYYQPANGGQQATGTTYTVTMALAPAPVTESYSNTLQQLTVTLNWDSGGVARTRSMSTFISQNGIATYKH